MFSTNIFDVILPEINTKNDDAIDYIFIVMEHIDMTLSETIQLSSEMNLGEDHVITLLYNILCAMNFMHTAGLIHRDIKPSNILVDNDCLVKFCDFGLARTRVK